jgi:hypothetical protein
VSDLFLERDAVISDCGKYRYLLRRTWDHDKQRVLIVMLNPSTADAEIDDNTIRSCIRLCKGLGYGSFEVVNLYAWRATDPDELARVRYSIGERNNATIEAAIGRCDLAICAWGAHPMAESWQRNAEVFNLLSARRPAVFCFGLTKSGAPKHPLYIKTGTPLQVYRGWLAAHDKPATHNLAERDQ